MLLSILLACLCSSASAQEMTVQTLDRIKRKYLWLDTLEVESALVSAAEELESHIPWMIVRQDGTKVSLHHGQESAFFTLDVSEVPVERIEEVLFSYLSAVQNVEWAIPNDVDLELVLLDGFAREMDRYSVMMYNDRLTSFNERISGNFSGIGCRVQKGEKGLEIQEVFPDGPAHLMGIKEGDVITHVDEIPLSALTLQQGVDRLRGETGTIVHVQFLRAEEPQEMSLVRARVRIPNVHWTIQDDVGVITIRNFSEQTFRFLEQALQDFESQNVQGLVLDLRNNGGGSMMQSCKVVDSFVTSGLTLKTQGRDGKPVSGLMKQYLNRNGFSEPKVPMVVLINSGSASASEIVSGSLKLLNRALIVGQKSYGKGVVQTASEIRRGDNPVSLKLTIAQYLLSNNYSVHEEDGIEPHIAVARIDTSEIPFVSISPEPSDLLVLQDGEDKELDFAVDVLKNSESSSVSELRKTANAILPRWRTQEDQKIQEVFKEHQIDWSRGDTEEVVQDISIQFDSKNIVQGGTSTQIVMSLHNNGPELSQSLLWLQAENPSSPWDDLVIPLDKIPENDKLVVPVPLDLPMSTISRYDQIRPILLRPCCSEVELDPIYVQTTQGNVPELKVSTQITQKQSNLYLVQFTVENTGSQVVDEVYGRFIWPVVAKQVRMHENEWRLTKLEPSQTQSVELEFSSSVPLKELPEVLLRLDLTDYNRWFRQQLDPNLLINKTHLQTPTIQGTPPVLFDLDKSSILQFEHSVIDDGGVTTYEAWWNGEKVHWQPKGGSVKLNLPMEKGHNNLFVEVTDDIGLQRKQIFTVFGLSSKDGESHLIEGDTSTPVGTEER